MIARRARLSLIFAAFASAGASLAEPALRGPLSAVAPMGTTGPAGQEHLYIVQMDEPPALAIPAVRSELQSKTAAGGGVDPSDPSIRQHAERLSELQDSMLAESGLTNRKVYSYRYTFNGVAMRLTEAQATKMRSRRGVQNVWQDQLRHVSTSDSSRFLGLFDTQGGLRTGLGLTGEDIVIGVIDSGISPGHPSFSDRIERKPPRLCRTEWAKNSLIGLWLCRRFKNDADIIAYSAPPADWQGACEAGEGFQTSDCNNKLIGARYYKDGFDISNETDPGEFLSARDADGHGTHIASTAAGNSVQAQLFGRDAGKVSGMAPRARIAVYKACWLEPGQFRASCSVADLQQAIEDAVADGVDIINYSIGDDNDSLTDPDDLALLAAADAGVLSVVAAGNDGPTPGTILSPGGTPWTLTVGAATRAGTKLAEALRVTKPASVAADYENREASFTPPLLKNGPITTALILVNDNVSALPDGSSGTTYDGCEPIVNSSEVNGKIAFLQRGGCTFEEKLLNADNAGAVAAVVFSDSVEPVVMAGTRGSVGIPAVMIGSADGTLLRNALSEDAEVEVTLDKSLFLSLSETGNTLGSFSARGPNYSAPDILKPDVVAPGVEILAGQTPDVANGVQGEQWQYLSGTSMAVPHVAGIAALLKQAHPDWSPAALKSALMTTARQDIRKQDRSTPADPFDMGAGHIVPNTAANPGLIYAVDTEDYDAYLCGTGQPRLDSDGCAALQTAGVPKDAWNLNLPSIAVADLVATTTVTRRVTNVGEPAVFNAEIVAPEGVSVEVTPTTLSLDTDESAEFTVTFSNDGSHLADWLFGSLTWVSEKSRVYSPLAVRPVAFFAPQEVFASGVTGSVTVPLQFGYSGQYTPAAHGLAAPCVLPEADLTTDACETAPPMLIADDPYNAYQFETYPPAWVGRVEPPPLPDNMAFLRVSLFNEDTDGNDDLDLYLYYCIDEICSDLLLVDSSGDDDSNEEINLRNPPPGRYIIDVHGFDTDQVIGGPGANARVLVWALGINDDRGNLALSNFPTSVSFGTEGSVTGSWADLQPNRYLGGISHADGPAVANQGITLITLDARVPTAP